MLSERPTCPASQHCDQRGDPEPRKPVSSVTGVRVTSSLARHRNALGFQGRILELQSLILSRRSSVLLKSRMVVIGPSSCSKATGQPQRSLVAVTPPRRRPPLHTSGNSRASLPKTRSDLSARLRHSCALESFFASTGLPEPAPRFSFTNGPSGSIPLQNS